LDKRNCIKVGFFFPFFRVENALNDNSVCEVSGEIKSILIYRFDLYIFPFLCGQSVWGCRESEKKTAVSESIE